MSSYAFFFNKDTFERKASEILAGGKPVIDYVGMRAERPFVNFSAGDELFIVGIKNKRVLLAGRMVVDARPVERVRAIEKTGRGDLLERAEIICFARPDSIQEFRADLNVPLEVARNLTLFKSNGELTKADSLERDSPDPYLFMACPRLSEESANSLRNLLEVTPDDFATSVDEVSDGDDNTWSDEYQSRAIMSRKGQPVFRQKLLSAYKGRCVITNCGVEELLEAAHIRPHAESMDYSVSNGLLLRADIHTLFDLNLLAVDEFNNVKLSESLKYTEYWVYNGKKLLRVPDRSGDMPNRDALCARLALLRN